MADQMYMVNPQSPVGIGPFAPVSQGQELAMTPEALRMGVYEELLRQQAQKPQTQAQQAPLDKMANRMGSKPFTGYVTDKTNPANAGLPILPNEFAETPASSQKTQQQPATQEQAPVEQSPEQTTPAAQQEIQKAIQETVKTPQDEQLLLNALSRPTEDGTQSIAQRIAMIAMAVAPTAVGFALEGRKGAYLGAAATGKGMQEGFKEYRDEQDFNRKMAIEQAKLSKERAGTFDKEIVNEYGQIFVRNKNNQVTPVVDNNGQFMFKPNEPRVNINPQTGEETITTPYRQRPSDYPTGPMVQAQGQQPTQMQTQEKKPGLGYKGGIYDELADLNKDRKALKLGPVSIPKRFLDPAMSGLRRDMTPQELADAGIDSMKYRQYVRNIDRWFREQEAAIEESRKTLLAKNEQAKNSEKQKALSTEMSIYMDNIKKFNSGEWKEYRTKQADAEYFFNRPLSEIKAARVDDSTLWFRYMKEVQGDQSVVREGDLQTAYAFMPLKTRVESFINQWGPNFGSKMTDGMRKDVLNYLRSIRSIKERIMMMDINDHVSRGQKLQLGRPAISEPAITAAKEWAARNGIGSAKIYGMAGGTPIFNQRIKEMVQKGELKNGQFIKDTDGQPYLIKFVMSDDQKRINGVFPVKWVVSNGK